MGSEAVLVLCCLSCLLLPSIVLQGCGFFSPYWINYTSKNITSTCFRGIIYNSGCPDDVNGLGATILGLQATSLAIIALTTVACIYFICCNRNDDDDDDDVGCCALLGGCLVCLYPVAGIVGFSGCMVVIAEFGDHEKGWAFYVSLAANCYVILELLLCCCVMCMKNKKEDESSGETGGQEVTPYGSNTSSSGMVVGQVLEHHQIGISSTGELIVRKLQFTRIFHIS